MSYFYGTHCMYYQYIPSISIFHTGVSKKNTFLPKQNYNEFLCNPRYPLEKSIAVTTPNPYTLQKPKKKTQPGKIRQAVGKRELYFNQSINHTTLLQQSTAQHLRQTGNNLINTFRHLAYVNVWSFDVQMARKYVKNIFPLI